MLGTAEERLKEIDQMYPKWESDTLWTRFEKSARCFSNQVFLVYREKEYTYADTEQQVNKLAEGLYCCGVRSGKHVAVILHNSPEYVFLIFALSKLGAVRISVNPKLSVQEKGYIVTQSESSFIVSQSEELLPLDAAMEKIEKIIIVGETQTDTYIKWEAIQGFVESLDAPVPVETNSHAVTDIMYTSGSTAFAKGVQLTSDMMLRSSFGTCRTRRMEIGRRILVPIPLYHIFAFNEGLLSVLWIGGSIILTDRKATGSYLLELLREKKANDIICVPIIMIRILEAIDEKTEALPDLHAAYWASTCPDWVWDEGKRKLGISDITTGYGMTECGSTSTMQRAGCTTEALLNGHGPLKECGCAGDEKIDGKLLETEIRNVENGKVLPNGEIGELFCRGLTVTPGYYKNDEANAKAFDEEGWFATGDMGCFDDVGSFTFQGRKDDVYKINGENVSPQYLNLVIGSCKEIRAVEVIGIKSPQYGEVGVAFVDLLQDTKESRQMVQSYFHSKLADFQIPKYVVIGKNTEWPRTSCGKIAPSQLRRLASEKAEAYEKKFSAEKKGVIWIR